MAAPLAINGVLALRAARATPFLAVRALPFLEAAERDALEPLDERDWVERDFEALARLLEAEVLLELCVER
jgi:hypothetical protein